jgi:prepilin-type N-terminal cleavage/methylation domain-containing protein
MNTVLAISSPRPGPRRQQAAARAIRAFTLLEVLVVVAIMAVLAGLVVGLSTLAGDRKKTARTQAELEMLVTAIESYKDKLGFYPPSGTNLPGLNPLYYELSGMVVEGANCRTLNGLDQIDTNAAQVAFGLGRFLNSASDPSEVKAFVKAFQPGQTTNVMVPDLTAPVKVLGLPVKGPWLYDGTPTSTNTWRYDSAHPTNNPNSYDLWAEIVVGSKTMIIGNWRK